MMEQHELIIPSGVTREIVIVHNSPDAARRVIRLAGAGASVTIEEIFVSGGVASELVIMHEAGNTISKVRSRGVVDKQETVKAHATVQVPKGITGCTTHVTQEFLLMDDSAKVDVLPALEIEEQDVSAGHKAAIAPLDEEKLFYLTARGLAESDAKKMIIQGFLNVPKDFRHAVGKWQ